jgi:hypothetical protein
MSKLDTAYKKALKAARLLSRPATEDEVTGLTRITENEIRYDTSRLSQPATEDEIALLTRELAGKYFKGYRFQARSLIVGALNDLRLQRKQPILLHGRSRLYYRNYKGILISKTPANDYEIFSGAKGKFLKFERLDDAKNYIDENKQP